MAMEAVKEIVYKANNEDTEALLTEEIEALVAEGKKEKALKKWCILYEIKGFTFREAELKLMTASEELSRKAYVANTDLEMGIALLKSLNGPDKQKIEFYAKPLLYFYLDKYNKLVSQPDEISSALKDFYSAYEEYDQALFKWDINDLLGHIERSYCQSSSSFEAGKARCNEKIESNGVDPRLVKAGLFTEDARVNARKMHGNVGEYIKVAKNLKNFETLFNETGVLPKQVKAQHAEESAASARVEIII